MDESRNTPRASAVLLSILELVDEPLMVADFHGKVQGANEALLAIARQRGVGVIDHVSDLVPGFPLPEVTESEGATLERDVELAGGGTTAARIVPLRSANGVFHIAVRLADSRAPVSCEKTRLRHDLAGPLTAILGTTELMMMRDGGLDPELREGLGEILAQCERISALIARDSAAGSGEGEESS